jgi:hypothetical protein
MYLTGVKRFVRIYFFIILKSTLLDYGLDNRAIEIAGQRIFLLVPASRPALGPTQPPIQWVPGVLSPGVKRGRGMMLTTHPHLVPRLSMSRTYTPLPHAPQWRVAGHLFIFFLHFTQKFHLIRCEFLIKILTFFFVLPKFVPALGIFTQVTQHNTSSHKLS